jgi:hypothetical protein
MARKGCGQNGAATNFFCTIPIVANITPRIKTARRYQNKEPGLYGEQRVDLRNKLAKEEGVAGGLGNMISLANLDAGGSA